MTEINKAIDEIRSVTQHEFIAENYNAIKKRLLHKIEYLILRNYIYNVHIVDSSDLSVEAIAELAFKDLESGRFAP